MDMKAKNILLVDDSELTCKVITALLSSLGCNVTAKHDGNSAISFLSEPGSKDLDLIILDVMMPDINGYDLLMELKRVEALNNIPIIMLTSKNKPQDMMESYEKGADYYISKPTNKEQLTYALEVLEIL